jgi:hypothetical protein
MRLKNFQEFINESSEDGIYVIGKTRRDAEKIKRWLKNNDDFLAYQEGDNEFFFPEEEETYQALKDALDMEFQRERIEADFIEA